MQHIVELFTRDPNTKPIAAMATIHGVFAVHPSPEDEERGAFVVTHVPTGLRCIPFQSAMSEEQATVVAEQLATDSAWTRVTEDDISIELGKDGLRRFRWKNEVLKKRMQRALREALFVAGVDV